MHFHICRICHSDENLKFNAHQLRKTYNSQLKNTMQKAILIAPPTLGNICYSCEEQLHNYHQLDDSTDSEVEVDVNVNKVSIGVETPIIVDDSAMLYELFVQKTAQLRQSIGKTKTQYQKRREELTQHSLGSDGDTEVIEVITSRENTPVATPSPLELTQHDSEQKIIAVIDLDLEEEQQSNNLKQDSNNRQITSKFEKQTTAIAAKKDNSVKKTITKRRRKKIYAESELRLIASLSLISSDSEVEDEKQSTPNLPIVEAGTTAKLTAPTLDNTYKIIKADKNYKCHSCHVRMSDAASLKLHEIIHTGVICPVCQTGFSTSQRLVHHMRVKHRSYDGDELSERPRCSQDSAMTIRLRYQQRYTYYECQLCGRIDAVFKEHKQHVLQRHAAESKLLRDPLRKELKCPVCHVLCGMQHLFLCRHLLSTHTATEYRPYLKELQNAHICGWNGNRQRNLEQTARIYQLVKFKSYFFECKECGKIVASHLSHMHHLKAHTNFSAAAKTGIVAKVKRKNAKNTISTQEHIATTPFTNNATITNMLTTPSTDLNTPTCTSAARRLSKRKRRIKTHPKAIRKTALLELHSSPEQTKAPALPAKRRLKRVSKVNSKAIATLMKVKIKPSLQNFSTQSYSCMHCSLVCIGFQRWNLHTLSAHAASYQFYWYKRNRMVNGCNCRRKCHVKENCEGKPHLNSQMERGTTAIMSLSTALPKSLPLTKYSSYTWLQDLLQMHEERTREQHTASSANSKCVTSNNVSHRQAAQCPFCMHLFATATELSAHEQTHLERKEKQLIKRSVI